MIQEFLESFSLHLKSKSLKSLPNVYPLSKGEDPVNGRYILKFVCYILSTTRYEPHVREDLGSCTRSCGWVWWHLLQAPEVPSCRRGCRAKHCFMDSVQLKFYCHSLSCETLIKNWVKEREGQDVRHPLVGG